MSSEVDKEPSCEYKLKPEEELRIEVSDTVPTLSQPTDGEHGVVLELKDGLAEVFGTELVCGNRYVFGPGSKFAVFSWYGCTVSVTGTPEIAYVAKETPMVVYLNTHAALETLRKRAEKDDKKVHWRI
jgi:polyribonucleotide 5'-hydroxyl-kinase